MAYSNYYEQDGEVHSWSVIKWQHIWGFGFSFLKTAFGKQNVNTNC